MNVFMTGGTGFIGRHLSRMLIANNFSVVVATRNPDRYVSADSGNGTGEPDSGLRYVRLREDMTEDLENCQVVINLAGESLFGKRWTPRVKKRLYDSRIQTTRLLISGMQKLGRKPDLFLSASGVNYYGDCGDDDVTEERGSGDDFLAALCRDWEATAREAESMGIRVINPRFGVALGADGGAMAVMLPVFRAFIGGSIGPGGQYFPWIHIDDLCRSILFAIENTAIEGPYNATAPDQVTMDTFVNTLGSVLSRPSFFKVPEFGVNMVLGEAALLLTASLKVIPDKIRKHGFSFHYDKLRPALEHLM